MPSIPRVETVDPLTDVQRARAAAAYEAARHVLGDDPMVEDVMKLADYIVTGRYPRDIRVLPSEDLIEQVVKRAGDVASGLIVPDAATIRGNEP